MIRALRNFVHTGVLLERERITTDHMDEARLKTWWHGSMHGLNPDAPAEWRRRQDRAVLRAVLLVLGLIALFALVGGVAR